MERRTWSLLAAILGSGVVFLDSTVVTVALSAIGAELPRVSSLGVLEAQSYVYNGYLLSLSALLIVGGALSDTRGRRRMYLYGLVGFGAATALCGLAPNMEVLIAGRVLQGAGGALLVPGSLALINAAYTGDDRSRAFGIWTGATAAVTILGPLAGGVLVDLLSWRAAFLSTLPILALTWWVTYAKVEESTESRTVDRIDWTGAALAGVGVAGLSFGPIRGQETAWQDPLAWVLIGAGLMAVIALVARIMRHPDALVPRALFSSRDFTVINTATFFVYGGLYLLFVVVSLFLQGTLGYNATAAGLATAPAMVPIALFSGKVGDWSAHTPARRWMVAGPTLMAIAAVWLSMIPATSTAWEAVGPASWIPPGDYFAHVFGGVLLFGIGTAIMVTPLTATLMNSVPPSRAGVGSAFNNAVSRVGPQVLGAVAIVIVNVVFFNQLDLAGPVPADLAPLNTPPDAEPSVVAAVAEASTAAFATAMWLVAGFAAIGALVSGLWLRGEPHEEGGSAGAMLPSQICVPTEVEPV